MVLGGGGGAAGQYLLFLLGFFFSPEFEDIFGKEMRRGEIVVLTLSGPAGSDRTGLYSVLAVSRVSSQVYHSSHLPDRWARGGGRREEGHPGSSGGCWGSDRRQVQRR